MADENNLGGKISLDITDFKTNVAQLNRSIREIDSGFKATAAGMEDWSKSSEGLSARINALNGIMDLQRKKLAALTEEYKRVVAEKGSDSKAAQDLQIKINNETAALNKNQLELQQNQKVLKNFAQETNKAGDETKKLTTHLKQIDTAGLKKMAVGIAVVSSTAVAAAAGIFKLAEKASDLSESQNVVTQTFKESADSIIEWTKTTAASAGISQTASTKFVGSMGAMLKSSGLNEKAAGDMAKSLVQLTGDMASFYNLSHEETWSKFRGGISGETEPLKQLGINMSVANMEAYALSQGINKAWTEMTQAEQTTLRYGYLMQVTADAQGDFARTSDGMANQTRIAQMQFESIVTTIGAALMPTVNSALAAVNEFLSGFDPQPIMNFASTIIDNGPEILAVIVAIAAGLATWNVVTMIQGVVKAVKAWQLANEGLTIAQLLLNTAMSANPVGIVIALIAALVAGLIVLWKTNENFRNAMIKAWKEIKSTVSNALNFIIGLFNSMVDSAFNWGRNLISGFVDGIKSMISAVKNAVSSVAETVSDFLGFSSPTKKGPGSKAGTWGPNLIKTLTEGMDAELGSLQATVSKVAAGLNPTLAVSGGGPSYTTNTSTTTITIQGLTWEEIERNLARRGVRIG